LIEGNIVDISARGTPCKIRFSMVVYSTIMIVSPTAACFCLQEARASEKAYNSERGQGNVFSTHEGMADESMADEATGKTHCYTKGTTL